jgi:hypothetical protein
VVGQVRDARANTKRQRQKSANVAFYGGVSAFFLLLAALLCNALFPVVGFLGLHFFVEKTDMMAPEAPRGSLLITVRKAQQKIEAGDVITFRAIEGDARTRLTRVVAGKFEDPLRPNMIYFETESLAPQHTDSFTVNGTQILGVKLAALSGVGAVLESIGTYSVPILFVVTLSCALVAVLYRLQLRGAFRALSARFIKLRVAEVVADAHKTDT